MLVARLAVATTAAAIPPTASAAPDPAWPRVSVRAPAAAPAPTAAEPAARLVRKEFLTARPTLRRQFSSYSLKLRARASSGKSGPLCIAMVLAPAMTRSLTFPEECRKWRGLPELQRAYRPWLPGRGERFDVAWPHRTLGGDADVSPSRRRYRNKQRRKAMNPTESRRSPVRRICARLGR